MPQSVKFSLEMRFVQLVFFCGLCAPECSSRRKRTRFKRHRHSGEQHCATKSSFYATYVRELRSRYNAGFVVLPGGMQWRIKEGLGAIDETVRFLRAARPEQPLTLSPGM